MISEHSTELKTSGMVKASHTVVFGFSSTGKGKAKSVTIVPPEVVLVIFWKAQSNRKHL
jgi:hypothetical protein